MPRWQEDLLQALFALGDTALGLAPALPVLGFLWLLQRASQRLPVAGAAALLMAAAGGAAVGLGATLLSPLGPYLTPGQVLAAGTWWDVPGATLATERIGLGFHGLGAMMGAPLAALPPAAAACASAALSLATICSAAALVALRSGRLPALPLIGASVTVGAGAVVASIAAVCVIAWTLSLLNFWAFGIALAVWQYRRHGTL
jgi:hypothetical protein